LATPRQNRPHLGRLRGKHDEREERFLIAFYAEDSESRGNKELSARNAGFSDNYAEMYGNKILKKYSYRKFQQALEACGINNLMMGMRVRRIIEQGKDNDSLQAIKLALANKGEITDERSGSLTVNSTAPVMVIVGANAERLKALRGAVPQLTKEQQEEIENQRCQERLEQLKRGELPQLPSKTQMKEFKGGKETESEMPESRPRQLDVESRAV